MKNDMWFKFTYDGKDILVPTQTLTEEPKRNNLSIYGTEYGVQELCVVDGDNVYKLVSNEVVSGSDVISEVIDRE